MMAKSHRAGGVAAWLGTCAALGVPIGWAVAGTPVAWSASLWPDWDHPQATLARKLGPVTYLFAVWVERRFGGHRAGTHSLLVGVPLAGVLGVVVGVALGVLVPSVGPVGLGVVLGAASGVGAASHVLLDCLTVGGRRGPGCEVLWPLRRRRFGVPLMETGGWFEGLVRPGLWVGAAAGAWLVVVGG